MYFISHHSNTGIKNKYIIIKIIHTINTSKPYVDSKKCRIVFNSFSSLFQINTTYV